MGRARNIFDLSLAVGAVVGIMAVASPQLLSIKPNLSSITSAQANGKQAPVEISHFLGIAQFVKNPTDYSFVYKGHTGEVVKASLVDDRMTIDYKYQNKDETVTGKLDGKVNSDGVFVGNNDSASYSKSIEKAHKEDNIQFSFAADGTAKGFYQDNSSNKSSAQKKGTLSISKD